MNPLSSWTYYRQHKGRAGLLIGFVALVVAGLYLMMAIFWAISVEPMRSNRMFLSRFSVLMPSHGNEMDAAVVAQVRANPDVERVIPAIHSAGISLPEATGGGTNWFNLLGLREEDLSPVLDACGAVVKEGDRLEGRTNGIMLSEQIARALGLQVGDVIHDEVNPKFYSSIVDPLEVVAILESEYGARARDLAAGIGPCIGPCHYQVDAPVIRAIEDGLGARAGEVLSPDGPGHARLDLSRANRIILERAGLPPAAIGEVRTCTYCRADLFYSYRREGKGVPSLYHFIGLE